VDIALTWWELLCIAVGLAMDALAVAIATGLMLAKVTPRHVFRLAFHFGLFQFLMPILGWLAGRQVAEYVGGWDHWLAFGLLSFVGGKMLWEARYREESLSRTDPTRGFMLVTLSVATSIDALAVGLSMGLQSVSDWLPSIVIGLVAAALTALGITFGGRLGPRWENRAEVAGGCVLLLIAAEILWSHYSG
jgi:manganese efflux pump family protein